MLNSNKELVNFIEKNLIFTPEQGSENKCSLHFFYRARYALYYVIIKIHKKYPKKKKILLSPFTIPEIPQQLKSLGFELVYYDVKANTLDPNWDEYKKAIESEELLCVIITDYCNVVEIPNSIISQGVCVVRDRALSFGVEYVDSYKNVISIYSFSAYKKVNTLLGGAIQINNKELENEILDGRNVALFPTIWEYFKKTWMILIYYLVMTYSPSLKIRNLIFSGIIRTKPYQRSMIAKGKVSRHEDIKQTISKFSAYPNPKFQRVIEYKISRFNELNDIYIKNYKKILNIIEKYSWIQVMGGGGANSQILSFIILKVEKEYSWKLKKNLTTSDRLQLITPTIYPIEIDYELYPNLSELLLNIYKVPINTSLTNSYFLRLDKLLENLRYV